jgi:hypothetical protein
LLKGVLEVWFECVVGLGGQVEEGVKVLVELIALGGSERGVDDLMGLLKVGVVIGSFFGTLILIGLE